jgi:hypothetical protein
MANVRIRDQGKLTLKDSDNSNSVSLQVPSTVSSSQDFILPNADGINNNVLKTDGSGNLSFIDIDTVSVPNINWQTGDVKTSNFITGSGSGFFVNTTSGAVTCTLAASPSVGDFVAFKDYAGTFATNNFTIARNGNNIQGSATDSVISTNRASVVLQYIDATKGWLYLIENNVGDLENVQYVTATGGTITTSGDFKIHTFNSSGTFTVSCAGNSSGSNSVDYLVIAGGGGSGGDQGAGGGGAGGYRESFPNPATGGLPVSAQGYPITIGAGGAAGGTGVPEDGSSGANSIFSSITSAGGGGGGLGDSGGGGTGVSGGSGGGGGGRGNDSGGAGNTPPVSPPQGNPGGNSKPLTSPFNDRGGGGGGVSAPGGNGANDPGAAGDGGAGSPSTINGSNVTRGGGGGGGSESSGGTAGGTGGSGGGGPGGNGAGGTAGTSNTGGGGGASGCQSNAGGAGGSGVVIIRYKYQN